MRLLAKLQEIPYRVVYLLVLVAIVLPFVIELRLPVFVSNETLMAYNTIEQLPDTQIVIFVSSWDAGIKGELWPQTEALMRHLMQRGIKFAIMSQIAQGASFAEEIAERVAKLYNKKYGVDWCNWGFLTGDAAMIQALAKNIPKTVQKDFRGTPLTDIPMMQGIEDISDVSLIIDIDYGPRPEWISFVHGPYGTPIIFGCASIVSSTLFPYIDSGQLAGLLVGVRGATEYESLLGYRGMGHKLIIPQSLAHLLIVILVLLGNIGYLAARKLQ